ncbi:endonuclease domain-containing protein [Mycolicibacterium austroafricanum]|uniref:endonuclease domain-containing protein n=1 Tax=Mycolicibacterium austroafricanum TaxID=39687 RepID=UPI002350E395|nr:endonuclease domain-containing protein [Mycolicibacterium austroafricanum]
MVIKTLLCSRESLGVADAAHGLSRYRTPEDIRKAVVALRRRPCFRPATGDKGCPPEAFANASRRKLYSALVRRYGPMCQSCGQRYGHVIDHDHFSRLVRGLLCRVCNAWIDNCVHEDANVCPYAGYLNEPPAERLALRYPASHRIRAMDEVRSAILGFDIMESPAWPSANPAAWRWEIPDAAYLEGVASDWWARHPNAPGALRLQREAR